MLRVWYCALVGLGISIICFFAMLLGLPKEVAASLLAAGAIAGTIYLVDGYWEFSAPLSFCLVIALSTSIIFNLTAGIGLLVMTAGAVAFWLSWLSVKQDIMKLRKRLEELRNKKRKD